jgi:hypothetical protein
MLLQPDILKVGEIHYPQEMMESGFPYRLMSPGVLYRLMKTTGR